MKSDIVDKSQLGGSSRRDEHVRHGCDTEPIHLLGGVQPHGLLLVVRPEDLTVVQFSAGWLRALTPTPTSEEMLASRLSDWVDASAQYLRDALSSLSARAVPIDLKIDLRSRVSLQGRTLTMQLDANPQESATQSAESLAHRVGSYAVLEWAPKSLVETDENAQITTLESLNAALSDLHASQDDQEFLSRGAHALRSLSGFDRVMLYRFLPDFSGEVISESVSSRTTVKFLGMRFPAGDIPPQARELYRLNPIRAMGDINVEPDALIPARLPGGQILDQSFCSLRSMSNAHATYLRNMGVQATMSVSLLRDGKLWGLLACHHLTPRVPPYHVRQSLRVACELIANVIVMRADDLQRLSYQRRMRKISDIVHDFGWAALGSGRGIVDAAKAFAPELLGLFGATSWGLRIGGFTASSLENDLDADGVQVGESLMDEVALHLANQPENTPLSINKLSVTDFKLPGGVEAAGLLAMRFGLDGKNSIAFFRPALEQVVHWGGKPVKETRVADDGGVYLEPRGSFDLWTEIVKGQSEDWSPLDLESLTKLADKLADHSQALINHELNEKLRWRARHDHLTGLLNRSALDSELNLLMQIPNIRYALFMIDLDHFKRVNDSLGHRVGDEVIKAVANRLSSVIRENDFACRFGGDEFILAVDVAEGQGRTPEVIAERLLEQMKLPIDVDSDQLVMGLSIGIALYPDHGPSAVDLMRRADIALYDAKARGRGFASVYTEKMESSANEAYSLESQLREGLSTDQLMLYYQPKVDLRNGSVVGVEALVRWQHPTRGLLGPDLFVPIAERCGLINQIGNFVITEAVAQAARWRDEQGLDIPVAVNVSFAQFANGHFVQELARALAQHHVSPDAIEIELTESILMEDTELARSVLKELQDLRVPVTLDDFGTGYSSLSYLHQLPLSKLKIDRSFIAGLEHDPQAQLITRAVLGLARGLRIQTVAEGVEDRFQLQWLKSHNCDMAQGYLFSRPVPSDEVKNVHEKVHRRWT